MKHKKYVIYSAMVGAYDDILQPLIVDERFDYVLFSNEIKEKNIGVWQIRPISYYNDDNTRICRYVKTHPEELLAEYEVSVWIDANIQIMTSYLYQRVVELQKNHVITSAMCHIHRECIYEEAFAVVNMMVEHEDVVVDWCHYLRKEQYPQRNGLHETNVIYRMHDNCCVKDMDELWWQCIDNFSRRDQLSFDYVLWKKGIPNHYMFGETMNARNTKHLKLIEHKNLAHNHCPISPNEAWLMRHCWKHKEDAKAIEQLYYRLYYLPFPKLWVALSGQYYRMIDKIKG